MKKLIFTFFFGCFLSVVGLAQQGDSLAAKWVYCEIVGTEKLLTSKLVVRIDFGQVSEQRLFWANAIRGEDGKLIEFNSMVDAMNYLGERGWEFVQAYATTSGNNLVYHWILKADKTNEVFFPRAKK